jgi:hypothetical protein
VVLTDESYEIRYDDDGELDEVVVRGCSLAHLERMDLGGWWLGLTLADGRTVHVRLGARNPGRTAVLGLAEVE